jgi:transforming growth factor-beta-induced protein
MLPPEEAPALQTIVEIAVGNPDFETLVAAVTAAGLVETLSGEGPFTVFAPTDDAFAALPAGTVDALLQDIPALTDVLTYHVISGEVPAADVVAATELTMLNGDIAAITWSTAAPTSTAPRSSSPTSRPATASSTPSAP